ncbi:histidinol-phosphatase [Burkholderia multivorans]|nr:histidinol-phosphatase [Burkholderia multivorans]
MNTHLDSQMHEFRRFTESLLNETRNLSCDFFRKSLTVDSKADDSPVTIADRAIETLVCERLTATFPDHGIYGEELGSRDRHAEYVWVIDPIDGTRSFISGFPTWGTLLALTHLGRPVLGAIDIPVLKERWIGVAMPNFSKTTPACRTSTCTRLALANLFATSPDMFTDKERDIFDQLSRAARFRRFGGDCYSYAMLAAGRLDAVVEAGLSPYDYLALVPVIQGAGGIITDWSGQPLSISSDGRVVAAATAELHRELLNYTKQA